MMILNLKILLVFMVYIQSFSALKVRNTTMQLNQSSRLRIIRTYVSQKESNDQLTLSWQLARLAVHMGLISKLMSIKLNIGPDVQSQTAVTAYSISKQVLLCGFPRHVGF